MHVSKCRFTKKMRKKNLDIGKVNAEISRGFCNSLSGNDEQLDV